MRVESGRVNRQRRAQSAAADVPANAIGRGRQAEAAARFFAPRITSQQSRFTSFLIDIWRLEIGVTCRKQTMAMHSNRHDYGTLPIGRAANVKTKAGAAEQRPYRPRTGRAG